MRNAKNRSRSRLLSFSAAALAAVALPLGLSACGTDAPAPEATADVAEVRVVVEDGWAKAGEGATSVFGTLENHGDQDLVIVSGTSDASDRVELHESVTSDGEATMREVEGGFELPAGGSLELAPGGEHLMLMDLHEELLAGDDVSVTLHFDDGSTQEITVLVKSTEGAQEQYGDHGDHEDHGDHGDDHDGH